MKNEGSEPDLLKRRFSESIDIRHDFSVGEKVSEFLRRSQVRSVVVADGFSDARMRRASTMRRANLVPTALLGLAAAESLTSAY